MGKSTYTAVLLGALLSAVANGMPSKREILQKLPENSSGLEKQFQPLMDFANDGCFQTAAIDINGRLNEGKQIGGAINGQCRDEAQLVNANTYSRSRCNNGVCAIMYEYYYEKDQLGPGSVAGGHKHDWENVVVFVRDGQVIRVAPSCHGDYDGAGDVEFDTILFDGSHPLILYQKDGIQTHCHKLATPEDRESPQNQYGGFFIADLVGWGGWPSEALRTAMNDAESHWGVAEPKTRELKFAANLAKAGAAQVGLDPNYDE